MCGKLNNRYTRANNSTKYNYMLRLSCFIAARLNGWFVPCKTFLRRDNFNWIIGLHNGIDVDNNYLIYPRVSPNFSRTCSIIDSYYLRVGDSVHVSFSFISIFTNYLRSTYRTFNNIYIKFTEVEFNTRENAY